MASPCRDPTTRTPRAAICDTARVTAHEGTVITTTRLRLRRLTVADAPAMAALLGDDHEAIRMTSHVPDPCTVDGARGWIALRSGPDSHPFAIEHGGAMIGCIGFRLAGGVAGLGYWIGRAHWGHGFATEAARAILAHAAALGAHRVDADTFTDNPASRRVLAKLGFTWLDDADEDQPLRGGTRRIARFAWTPR